MFNYAHGIYLIYDHFACKASDGLLESWVIITRAVMWDELSIVSFFNYVRFLQFFLRLSYLIECSCSSVVGNASSHPSVRIVALVVVSQRTALS